MKKITETVKTVVIIALLAGVAFFWYKFYNFKASVLQYGEVTYSSEIIEEKIADISELVTLEYAYTMSEKSEGDYLKLFKWDIPFTEKFLIVQYNGIIKYSTDLSNAKVSLNDDKVTVTIPHCKISSHEIDEDSWQFLDEKSGLFNPLTPSDDADIRKDAKAKMENRAKELNLAETADQNAINQIKLLLQSAYPELTVEIVFAD